jgi:hypothetical protein
VERQQSLFFAAALPNSLTYAEPDLPAIEIKIIMASQNWHTHFVNRPGNERGNKDTAVYSTVWAQAMTNNAKLKLLTNDTSTAVLTVDANNKIIFVHSFKNLGGTILEPINRFTGFIGNGRVASAILINDSSLLAHVNIMAPLMHP